MLLLLSSFGNAFDVSVRYSMFSGSVARVSVGTPPQALDLAIGFDEGLPFLLVPRLCPMIQGTCFVGTSSSTFQLLRTQSNTFHLFGLRSSQSVTDMITLPGGDPVQSRFELVDTLIPNAPAFKEVAGLMSMNKHSPFMQRQIVIVRPIADGYTIRKADPGRLALPEFSLPTIQNALPGWTFAAAKVAVAGSGSFEEIFQQETDWEIKFDPNVRLMKIPHDVANALMGGPLTGSIDRAFQCDSVVAVSLKLDIVGDGSRIIEIPMHQLVVQVSASLNVCRYRFEITSKPGTIKIGSQLINAVSEIRLDQISNRIGFTLQLPTLVAPYQPSIILAPIFRSYRVSYGPDRSVVQISMVRQGSIAGGLIPATRYGVHANMPLQNGIDTSEVSLWSFVYGEKLPVGQYSLHTVGRSSFSYTWSGAPRMDPITGSLIFEFRRNPVGQRGYTILFELSHASVGIYVARLEAPERISIDDLDLPAPYRQPKSTKDQNLETSLETASTSPVEEESKCFCLNDYDEHDLIQVLKCQHRFHYECIRQWVEGQSQTCPVCRADVKERGITTTQQPSQLSTFSPA